MTWRDHLQIHPDCDLFPCLPPDELQALGQDIKKNGLQQKIKLLVHKSRESVVIDGRNRLDAMQAVGLCPVSSNGRRMVDYFDEIKLADDQVVDYIISANIHRRHLNAKQKARLTKELLKKEPASSDRRIARKVQVDHKTVGKIRKEQEARGEIPHAKTRTDSKGRKQQAQKPVKAKAIQPPTVGQRVEEMIRLAAIADKKKHGSLLLDRVMADVTLVASRWSPWYRRPRAKLFRSARMRFPHLQSRESLTFEYSKPGPKRTGCQSCRSRRRRCRDLSS
jgi:hypothetical protein